VSATPFCRRLLRVTGMRKLGAYQVLHVADPGSPAPAPGQFAMIAAAERWGGGEDERPYLARAFSLLRCGHGEWQFLLEDVGPGTRRLCELAPGDAMWALGPLGRGFQAPPASAHPLLVGGGVGIAPLAILSDTLAGEGTVMLGFRDSDRAAGAELIAGARVASDDGSVGHHGPVTELLAEELERRAPRGAQEDTIVYACGPPAMLEAVRALCERTLTPAQLALEAGMACGYGACFGCVVPGRDGRYLRVCVDGPVFDARELAEVRAHGHAAPAPAALAGRGGGGGALG
jgi:NAD(P)H-flavin reductase